MAGFRQRADEQTTIEVALHIRTFSPKNMLSKVPQALFFLMLILLWRFSPAACAGPQPEGRRGEKPPRNFFAPLEKCVGHRLKLLDIVQKLWTLS